MDDDCSFLDEEGRCNGLYFGFTCIREKCRMVNRHEECAFCLGGEYCAKYNRFGCVGKENCGSKDDYMSFIRAEKGSIYQ